MHRTHTLQLLHVFCFLKRGVFFLPSKPAARASFSWICFPLLSFCTCSFSLLASAFWSRSSRLTRYSSLFAKALVAGFVECPEKLYIAQSQPPLRRPCPASAAHLPGARRSIRRPPTVRPTLRQNAAWQQLGRMCNHRRTNCLQNSFLSSFTPLASLLPVHLHALPCRQRFQHHPRPRCHLGTHQPHLSAAPQTWRRCLHLLAPPARLRWHHPRRLPKRDPRHHDLGQY